MLVAVDGWRHRGGFPATLSDLAPPGANTTALSMRSMDFADIPLTTLMGPREGA